MSSLNPSASPYIPSQKLGFEHQSETDEASGFQSESHLGTLDSVGHITDDHALSKDEYADQAAACMEQDLNYMSSLFPDSSRESLADIYHASNGDLEASIEMMKELEDFVATKDLEHRTKIDGTINEGTEQGCDATGESSSSK